MIRTHDLPRTSLYRSLSISCESLMCVMKEVRTVFLFPVRTRSEISRIAWEMFHVLHAAFLAALRFLRFYRILETPTAGEYCTTSALLFRGSFSPEDVPPTIPGLPQSTSSSGDCVAADGTGKPRAKRVARWKHQCQPRSKRSKRRVGLGDCVKCVRPHLSR